MSYRNTEYPYVLGRGKILIKEAADHVWYDLFHVNEFKFNLETEEKEHENFRRSLKVVDATAILKAKAGFSFTVDVPIISNVQRFLLADDVAPTAVVQTGLASAETEITILEKGAWQFIRGATASVAVETYQMLVTKVTTGATPTTLVEDTDFAVDKQRGMIVIFPETSLTDSKVKVTTAYPTLTASHNIKQVKAGTSADMRRHLWYQGDPASGIIQDVRGYVLMRPTGDMDFISDEWQGFGFEGSFLAHDNYGPLGLLYEQRWEVGTAWISPP